MYDRYVVAWHHYCYSYIRLIALQVLQYIPHLWVNGSVTVGGAVAGLNLPVFDANRQREMRTYVLQAAAGALGRCCYITH